MRYCAKHIMIVLMLLLVPIYLISCSGNSSTSLPSSNISMAVKSEPTNVIAVGLDSRVTISWTPPSGAVSYNLYWNTTTGVTKDSDKILNVYLPFDHRDLMNGKTYYYRVSAVYTSGESNLSSEVQATPMPPFTKILTKLTDPDAEQWDEFGWAVAMDGDYAVVGAWRSGVVDQNAVFQQDAGAAYVFVRTNGTWTGGARLTAYDAQADDHFGCAVSISGEYVVVGAMDEDGGTGDPMIDAGAVYIFRRTSTNNTWDAGVKILGPDPNPLGHFGASVSISGDYAIVGQEAEGRAYIFRRTDMNAWDSGTIVRWGMDAETGDKFGHAVAISGDYAIVGAPSEDGGPANDVYDAGAAYIFHRTSENDNSWELAFKIRPYDYAERDMFGCSVAISGVYAAVGAPGKNNDTGAVYVFLRQEENYWSEGPKVTALDGREWDGFGASVAITDKYLLVGAGAEDCGWDENFNEGAAYLYERIGINSWDGGSKITIPEGDQSDHFGSAVALSGENAMIGAAGDSGGEANEIVASGAVYLY